MMNKDHKAIDSRRELLGKQMVDFANKLVEWTLTDNKTDVTRFSAMIVTLQRSNLKLLCKLIGKIVCPVAVKIKNKEAELWLDPLFNEYLNREVLGDTQESFNFASVFSAEKNSEAQWSNEIYNSFWQRLGLLVDIYMALNKIDPDMPIYTLG